MAEAPPPKILIIEDDDGKRYTIARQLRASGFEIWEAETGEEGLRLVREIPDLVLLDIKLPDASGLEVCRRIKADPETSSILVLALSARFTSAPDRARGLEHGADAYLVHPVDLDELIATVRALLRLRQAERDRTRLSAEIEASERRYRTITETTTVGLCLVDAEERCTFLNRAAEELLGRKASTVRGQKLYDLIKLRSSNGSTVGACDWIVSRVLSTGEPVRSERCQLETADGTLLPVELTASAISASDVRVGAVVEIKDLRELARAEQQRDLFLATLGHDLRGPLQTIAMGAELFDRVSAGLGERERKAVQRMLSSTRRMDRLIEHTLTFARTLVEGVPLNRKPCDLAEICATVVRDATGREPHRPIFQRGASPVTGRWDPDRLMQVLDNLINNAIRHGDGAVTTTLSIEGDDATVSVHNLGMPIPRAALPTLFDPFRRAGPRQGGVGLGLYIVDKIVRAHGGSIDVTSDYGHGTTFTVRLPREAP